MAENQCTKCPASGQKGTKRINCRERQRKEIRNRGGSRKSKVGSSKIATKQ